MKFVKDVIPLQRDKEYALEMEVINNVAPQTLYLTKANEEVQLHGTFAISRLATYSSETEVCRGPEGETYVVIDINNMRVLSVGKGTLMVEQGITDVGCCVCDDYCFTIFRDVDIYVGGPHILISQGRLSQKEIQKAVSNS